MLRFILLLALCQVASQYHLKPGRVMIVVLEMEHGRYRDIEDLYEDIERIFHDFGAANNYRFNRWTLKRVEAHDSNGILRAKYELNNLSCLEFQDFLLTVKSNRYHLRNLHVFCGSFSFTLCMAFECPEDTFPNIVKRLNK
ncbi:hypothetical protein Aduo_007849 [Ancylostoma duodenale]